MSFRYRKNTKFKRPYTPKYFFLEKEIDFTTQFLDYNHFLLQEFFTADVKTREILSIFYINEYGTRSFSYLNRKYSEWANGDYHLSNLMKERIISMMPLFLNENAKHKLGIHEFMSSIKDIVRLFQTNQKTTFRNISRLNSPQEIVSVFEQEYEKIQTLTIKNLKFNILTEDEKIEALELSKYIIEIKLQKAFNQIERDFNIFLPFMYMFNRGSFSASYKINLFNIEIDITNIRIEDIEIPEFKLNDIESNSRFKEYSDKYLAYELVEINKEVNKSVSDSLLNEYDIQLFHEHYFELTKGESEVNMSSNFQGEGGELHLKVNFRPLKLLKKSIFKSLLKLSIILILLITSCVFSIKYKLYILLIFGGLFLGITIFNLFREEIYDLKNLIKEFKRNGK